MYLATMFPQSHKQKLNMRNTCQQLILLCMNRFIICCFNKKHTIIVSQDTITSGIYEIDSTCLESLLFVKSILETN